MSWFTDYRSHYFVGQLYGLTLRSRSDDAKREAIVKLDLWAYEREWKQNLGGKHPDPQLSARQLREAFSWGLGVRNSVGMKDLPFPSPPYPAKSFGSDA